MRSSQRAISRHSAQSKKPRPRVAYDVRAEIKRLAALIEPPTAREIQLMLDQDPRFAGRVPPLRTVQNIAQGAAVVDDSEPWSLAHASGAVAGMILPVLALVAEETKGRRSHITLREARWIIRVRRARPDLLPWLVWRFARAYLAAESRETSTADLDLQLALAPEQKPLEPAAARAMGQLRYRGALTEGWLPSATFLIQLEGETRT